MGSTDSIHDGFARFQERARSTHDHLVLAHKLDCPTGEETLTDNNLIEFMRHRFPRLVIYKARGNDEPRKGFDWEWYIGSDGTGWRRYAVQARNSISQPTGTRASVTQSMDDSKSTSLKILRGRNSRRPSTAFTMVSLPK